MNSAAPTNIIRLRPNRSASTPHGTMTAALTIVNRLLIHESCATDAPGKSARIAGNATIMIDNASPLSPVVVMTMANTQFAPELDASRRPLPIATMVDSTPR